MGKLLRIAQGYVDGTLIKDEIDYAEANERVMRQVKSLRNTAKPIKPKPIKKAVKK